MNSAAGWVTFTTHPADKRNVHQTPLHNTLRKHAVQPRNHTKTSQTWLRLNIPGVWSSNTATCHEGQS